MPLSGALAVEPLIANAPALAGFDAEPWETPGVELLHVTFEMDDRAITDVLPPALHPVLPPTVIFTVARYPETPVGPFMLAQVRVGCRASALPRGFLLRAYSDSPAAVDALRSSWGYDVHAAEVRLRHYHDRIIGSVALDGRPILEVMLLDQEAISGGDIQYVANMNLARVPEDPAKGVLIQVDPGYSFRSAERGRPEVALFDQAAWRATGVQPVWPVAASCAMVDTGFPKIRYVLDPNVPAIAGTRKVL
jgi:hypothetical protein